MLFEYIAAIKEHVEREVYEKTEKKDSVVDYWMFFNNVTNCPRYLESYVSWNNRY